MMTIHVSVKDGSEELYITHEECAEGVVEVIPDILFPELECGRCHQSTTIKCDGFAAIHKVARQGGEATIEGLTSDVIKVYGPKPKK